MNIWTNQEIGRAVMNYRKHERMTQEGMATLIGISRNYLSMIERGEAQNISLDVYRSICDWIGLPQARQETFHELFVEMYTAYAELAGVSGCDSCMDLLAEWKRRYAAITGHIPAP